MQELTNFKILLNEQRIRLDNYARQLADISSGLAAIGQLLTALSVGEPIPDPNKSSAESDQESFPPGWNHGPQ